MELHIVPVDETENADRFILFRPLLGLAFVGNRAMVELVQATTQTIHPEELDLRGRQKAFDFLRQVGFLHPDPPLPAPPATQFQPTMAVLLMTNQCQLRCVYCYAAAGELPSEQLTIEQGRAAIDIVCQNAQALGQSQFEISFHGGGEPTYAWRVLRDCVTYARQKPLSARITLTSNGIWSTAQREWIRHHIDGLTLSWDGTPELQNRQRPFTAGQGSADVILAHIAELDKYHYPYSIRMTATNPWPGLVEGIRFICEYTGCQSIQVEPSFNQGRGGHGLADRDDCLAFAEAFLEALEITAQAGRRLMYSGARLGLVTSAFCTAPYNALIVRPGGGLVSCYEVTGATHPLARLSAIGQLQGDELQVVEPARHHLHALMADRRQQCQGCFCYWSCAGDCYTRTFVDSPEGHQRRGSRCTMNQTITRRMLLNGIAAGDGVWRREGTRRNETAGNS